MNNKKINRNKKTGKKFAIFDFIYSIRVQMFITIFVVLLIPVVLGNLFLLNITKKDYIDQKITKLQAQNTMLRNCILSENYMDTLDSSLVKAELNRLANGYDGRIEIINTDFIIVTDTFALDENKTSVSELVFRSMAGDSVSLYNEEDHYLEFAMPIVIVESKPDSESNEEPAKMVGALYTRYSTEDAETFSQSLVSTAISIDAIVFVIALLLAALISKYISIPFKNAEKTLQEITAGDTGKTIEIAGYTEIRQIGEGINHLLDKLGEQEKSRQEFVSNVSHELKTPITSMKVLADSLIGQEDVPEELYQEFLTDIGKEIDRENDIITDLLSLVRMDKEDADINIAPCNINDMVELTLKRLRPIAALKNIEVVFESFRPVVAEVDEVKFTIVISNLVENAIKYNINDGWVRVSLNADHQYFYIKVQDSGIGIAEDDQEKIFERFFRVDKARSRETGGTGLGLAITKRIVVMHKGIIKVHSAENEGTTFTVRVPLKYIG
ncbi:MAG: HAMP domain-containing protein [Lachnospiraceae bacterium]|nr:HAMP domain-containing protein [Lachnospiraceae bacterium]